MAALMQTYLVGGAVRDRLLGLPVQDRDYVVTGATPEHMLALGYKPVGRDFPVFLHPQTHQEYALARTERKQGSGHQGFVFYTGADVSIEADLIRRDLTINAIAEADDGTLIDPYNGRADLQQRILRHVSPAFAEDPLRVLRVARFAASLAPFGFTIAAATRELMQQLSNTGELQTLSTERIWQELHKALSSPAPQRFIEVLRDCGALTVLLPEVDVLFGVPQVREYHPEIDTGEHVLMTLELAAQEQCEPIVIYALLLHDLGKAVTPAEQWPAHHGHEAAGIPLITAASKRLTAPKKYTELAQLVGRWHVQVHRALDLQAKTLLKLLENCDALRRPERFTQILLACEMDKRGRKGRQNTDYPPREYLTRALRSLQELDLSTVDINSLPGMHAAEKIRGYRLRRLHTWLQEST